MALPTQVRVGHAISSTTNSSTWTPTITWTVNNAISSGVETLWLAFVASDGASTPMSASGWTKVTECSESTLEVSGAVFKQTTTTAFAAGAAPSFDLVTTGPEQYTIVMVAYTASGSGTMSTIAATPYETGGPTTSAGTNPWTNTSGATIDAVSLVGVMTDAGSAASAPLTGYTSVILRNGSSGNASQRVWSKNISAMAPSATEPAAAVTTPSQESVGFALGVYEATATAASVTPDNLTSVSQVDSPAVTGYAGPSSVTPATLTSLSQITSPTIAAKSAVTPDGMVSASLLGSPSLLPKSSVSPNALTSASLLGSPTVAAKSSVSPASLTSLSQLGTPSVAAGGTLVPNDLTSASTLSSPTVAAKSTVAPTSMVSTSLLGSPNITPYSSSTSLTPDGSLIPSLISEPVLSTSIPVVTAYRVTVSAAMLSAQVTTSASVATVEPRISYSEIKAHVALDE